MVALSEEMDDGFNKPEEVVAKEKDGEDLERAATAQQGSIGKDEELVAVNTAASERLPFSKARCIALVATVGAAPFLSVSCDITVLGPVTDGKRRLSQFKLPSSSYPRSERR